MCGIAGIFNVKDGRPKERIDEVLELPVHARAAWIPISSLLYPKNALLPIDCRIGFLCPCTRVSVLVAVMLGFS